MITTGSVAGLSAWARSYAINALTALIRCASSTAGSLMISHSRATASRSPALLAARSLNRSTSASNAGSRATFRA